MIKLYYATSSSSCRKAKTWLIENHLSFEAVNLNTTKLTREELLHILSLTESGTDDVISKKSKAYQALDLDFDSLSLNEIVALIDKNHSLIRRPLIVDEKRLQVGFNDDDMRKFVPRQVRTAQNKFFNHNLHEIYKIRQQDNQ